MVLMNKIWNLNTAKIILMCLLLFLLIYGLSNKYNAIDFDLWVRLIAGKHVAQTGSVMYNDLISYTPTHTWYDPEWLSSTFLYIIISKFGVMSIAILKILLLFINALALMYAICTVNNRKFSSLHIELLAIFISISFVGGSSGFLLRCQLFTYLIMPFWIIILEKISQHYSDDKVKKYLIIAPILMLLWLNIHGGCIAGVGVLMLYIIGRFIDRKPVKKYLLLLIPIFLVFFINPWGYQYIKFMIHSSHVNRNWIIEWLPILSGNFQHAWYVVSYMIFIAIMYISSLVINRFKNFDCTKLLVTVAMLYLACAHFKHAPLFVIISAIYMYNDIAFVFNKIFSTLCKFLKLDALYQKYIYLLKETTAYLAVFGTALYFTIMSPSLNSLLDNSILQYPINAVNFIRENNIKGNMFLPYYYGSYMAYKTYPNIKIYMDGRQEQVYDFDIFDRHMLFLHLDNDNRIPIVEQYVPDIYLVEQGWGYNEYVQNNPNYSLIFTDGFYSLYIRNGLKKSSYKQVRNEYKFNKDTALDTYIDFRKK